MIIFFRETTIRFFHTVIQLTSAFQEAAIFAILSFNKKEAIENILQKCHTWRRYPEIYLFATIPKYELNSWADWVLKLW